MDGVDESAEFIANFSFLSSFNLLNEIFRCMSSDRLVDDFFRGGLWFVSSFTETCLCSSSDADPESDSDISKRLCSVGVMLGKWRSLTIFFSPENNKKRDSQVVSAEILNIISAVPYLKVKTFSFSWERFRERYLDSRYKIFTCFGEPNFFGNYFIVILGNCQSRYVSCCFCTNWRSGHEHFSRPSSTSLCWLSVINFQLIFKMFSFNIFVCASSLSRVWLYFLLISR